MIVNPYKFPFIVLEGIDGCGKSSIVEGLKRKLTPSYPVHFTAEPVAGRGIEQRIQEILKNNGKDEKTGRMLSNAELQSLFIFDRMNHRCSEEKFLANFAIISDRDWESTIAYYMSYGGNPRWVVDEHERIFRAAKKDFFVADLTLVIDVSAEVAYNRQQAMRKILDLFEADLAKIHQRVDAYRSLPKVLSGLVPGIVWSDHIQFVDGERSPDEVFEDVLGRIHKVAAQKARASEQ